MSVNAEMENPMFIMSLRRFVSLCCFIIPAALLLFMVQAAVSQRTPVSLPPETSGPLLWKSDHARHLLGLAEAPPNKSGTLVLSSQALVFTSPSGETVLERAKVVSVSAGDIRMETGGRAGRIGRKLIPFGGGSVVATMTQAQVDLLTVEFRDSRNAYHGAVFILPKSEALNAMKIFGSPASQQAAKEAHPACTQEPLEPASMKLTTINTVGVPIPVEYKVLLYEELMRRIQEDGRFGHLYRDGDQSPQAACPTLQLNVTLNAFVKGNQAVRASTGPLGMFLGVTSLKYHIHLTAFDGKVVLDRDLKESERGDSDSLDIANKIAKSVTKKLKKTPAHQRVEMAKP